MHDDTLPFHAETRADGALTAILQRLFTQLNDNEVGVIAGNDPECLHDFRVTARRTRSALGHIKTALPAGSVADYRRRFTWLASISGPTRDLDVYLLRFDAFRDRLPVELRTALIPLRNHRHAPRRRTAQAGEDTALAALQPVETRLTTGAVGICAPLTAAAALHDVRKTSKKLRYLMQFLRICPQAALRALLEPLEALQDVLGAHQDLHVQEATLGDV